MPQEFQVLQCYSCNTFQVHQVKKTTKWACKMCGEKQSLKKVFGRGSGADCRQHVQKLNTMRGEMDQNAQNKLQAQSFVASNHLTTEQDQINTANLTRDEIHFQEKQPNKSNKWNAFVEDGQSLSSNLDDDYDDDNDDYRYTTDAVKFKQGRKRKRESKGGNYCKNVSQKWAEFSGATNTGLYGNSSAYNFEEESGLNELPVSSGSWHSQSSNSAENKHGIYNQDSSLWRNKWNTYDTDEPSSQESFSNSVNENFAKRIKSETLSTIVSKVKGDSDWMQGNKTMKSTKWSTYTERDLSSQESQNDNLERLPETDSRPYVTYDPSGISSKISKVSYEEPVSVSENTGYDSQSRGRNDFKIVEKNNTMKGTKWSTYTERDLSSQESQNDNLEELLETDSRPYVTYDPSGVSSKISKVSYEEPVSVSENTGYDSQSRGRNDFKIVEKNNTRFSKWTGFINSAEEWKHSDSEQDSNAGKQNYSEWASSNVLDKPGKQKYSKWTEYAEDDKSSREEQQENCQLQYNTVLSDDNNFVLKQNTVQHSLSPRHLKSIGNNYNTGRLTNNIKVKPLFTTGDLDDTDLEL